MSTEWIETGVEDGQEENKKSEIPKRRGKRRTISLPTTRLRDLSSVCLFTVSNFQSQ